MKDFANFVMARALVKWVWDGTPAIDWPLHTTRLPTSPSGSTNHVAGSDVEDWLGAEQELVRHHA